MNDMSRMTRWYTQIILIIFLLVIIFPIYWMIASSLRSAATLFDLRPSLWINDFSFEWYNQVFYHSKIPQYFLNSFVIAAATMCANIIVATLGAYSLTRFTFRGKKFFMLAVLLSYIFPPILLLLPLYDILSALGLIDTYTGIIITHITFTIPFSLWILRSFFKSVPLELEEAGMIDGLSRMGAFVRIVLPLTAAGILSVGLFSFIMSWDEFLYASVFLPGVEKKTLPIGITEFIAQYDVRWGEIMASSTLTTIPVLILFISIQKYFVQGLTAGAVKG